MTDLIQRFRERIAARLSDPAVQDWHAKHQHDVHAPCDRCGNTQSLSVRTCCRCTFALCPRCYLKHLFMSSIAQGSLCTAVVEWAEFHAAFRQDTPDAIPA